MFSDTEFLAAFVVPFGISIASTLPLALWLEWVVRQPWSRQYHIVHNSNKNNNAARRFKTEPQDLSGESIPAMIGTALVGSAGFYALHLDMFAPHNLTADSFPTLSGWMLQVVALLYVFDFIYYLIHYACHKHDFLWKHIHAKHHHVPTPTALAGGYATVLDGLLVTAVPILSQICIVQPHATAFYVALAVELAWFIPLAHSGLDMRFPLLPFGASTRLHDVHHASSGRSATHLASLFWIWDVLGQTTATGATHM